ncbi:MAG: ABC transporter substrate-binding protein, partial [Desulfovibrionaceae bacterium]
MPVLLFGRPAWGHDDLEPVTLQLRWFHQFQFAGYYAAKELGFYREAGLLVAIRERDNNQDPVREVLEGRADFGASNAEVLLRKMRGDHLVVLAAIFQHSPLALVAREETGVIEPRHLKGRTVKMTSHPRDAAIQAMLRNAGVQMSDLHLTDGEVGHKDYLNPDIDALSAYITNEPYYLDQRGVAYRTLLPREYGVDFYGDCLFTSEELVDARPELVAAFTAASLKGWEYAMSHPEETIDLILTRYGSKKSREHLRHEAERMRELILPDLVPMGAMNRERWRRMAATFVNLDMAAAPTDMDAMLDQFSPAAASQKMAPWLRWLLWSLAGLCLAGALISLGLLLAYRRLRTEVRQRRRAEEELRFQSSILKQIDDLVVATDLNGRIVYVNDAECRMLGKPRQELLGQMVSAFGEDPAEGATQQEILDQTLAQGSWSGEVVNVSADGRRCILHCRTWIMRDETGEPVALGGVSTDITERKEAEKSLRQREQELAAALKRIRYQVANSPLGVVEWEGGTRISQWSRRAEEIFGWKAEEVLGKKWKDFPFIVPEDMDVVAGQIGRLFTGEDEYNTVLNRNYAKDGSVLHCQWYNSPLRDESGAIISILSQVQDITEWTRAQEELIRAKEAAEAANRAKSEFLANMSHEIRTPLNGSLGMLQLLKTTDLDEEQRYFTDTAITAAGSLLRILGDILDLSKIESGRMDILEEPFDIPAVVEPVVNSFRETAASKGVDLLVDVDPALPST